MWDIISLSLIYIKKKKGYIPRLLLLPVLLLLIGGAFFSLKHDLEPDKYALKVDSPKPHTKETIAPPQDVPTSTTRPVLTPPVEPIKIIPIEDEYIPQAERNSEPIPNFSQLNTYLTQSLIEQGYDESLSRNLMDKIRQNLINEDGGEERLIQTIKEELPSASDEEVLKIKASIGAAVGRIADENKNKPGYPQPGPISP